MNFLLLIEDRIHNDKLVSVSAESCQIIGPSETTNKIIHPPPWKNDKYESKNPKKNTYILCEFRSFFEETLDKNHRPFQEIHNLVSKPKHITSDCFWTLQIMII